MALPPPPKQRRLVEQPAQRHALREQAKNRKRKLELARKLKELEEKRRREREQRRRERGGTITTFHLNDETATTGIVVIRCPQSGATYTVR